jgi:hypothetical protein
LTSKGKSGESGEGEGRSGAPTTSQIARYLADEVRTDGRTPQRINVQYVTEGLYAVSLEVRETPGEETFFLRLA